MHQILFGAKFRLSTKENPTISAILALGVIMVGTLSIKYRVFGDFPIPFLAMLFLLPTVLRFIDYYYYFILLYSLLLLPFIFYVVLHIDVDPHILGLMPICSFAGCPLHC